MIKYNHRINIFSPSSTQGKRKEKDLTSCRKEQIACVPEFYNDENKSYIRKEDFETYMNHRLFVNHAVLK